LGARPDDALSGRPRRLRAPLLLALGALLAFEAGGGLVIFVARLAAGRTPGETLHVVLGCVLLIVYAIYPWNHWRRVAPLRSRLDYGLGLLAAGSMVFVNVTGLLLGVSWWRDRVAAPVAGEVEYPALLSAMHNIASMLILTFAGAHLGAVLFRDARRRDVAVDPEQMLAAECGFDVIRQADVALRIVPMHPLQVPFQAHAQVRHLPR